MSRFKGALGGMALSVLSFVFAMGFLFSNPIHADNHDEDHAVEADHGDENHGADHGAGDKKMHPKKNDMADKAKHTADKKMMKKEQPKTKKQ